MRLRYMDTEYMDLVMSCYVKIALLKMTIEIVDLPIEHGDFP